MRKDALRLEQRRRPDPSPFPGCKRGQAATKPRRPALGRGGSSRSCRASTDRRVLSNERASSNRSGRTGLGAAAAPSGSSWKNRRSAWADPAGSCNLGACRSENQKTTSFPPGLSYQSLARFLGRVFPVILEEKLSQRVERLRVIGIGEPGPFIGLESEIHLSGSTQRPAEKKEIFGVHVLEEESRVDRDRRLVPVLLGRGTGRQSQGRRVIGNLFEAFAGQKLGLLPIPSSIGRAVFPPSGPGPAKSWPKESRRPPTRMTATSIRCERRGFRFTERRMPTIPAARWCRQNTGEFHPD